MFGVSSALCRSRTKSGIPITGYCQLARNEGRRVVVCFSSDLGAVADMSSGRAFSGPARVPRGTAPAAAFTIPEEGVTVPKHLSFLERFHRTLGPKPEPEPEREAPAVESDPKPASNTAISTSASADRKADAAQVNALASAVAHLKTKENEPDEDINSKKVELVVKTEEKVEKQDSAAQPEPKFDKGVQNGAKLTEEFDDDNEGPSLSFPALRLCASSAIIDRTQLESLGLPLGFVWSPFGDLSGISSVSRDPQRCGTCGSFLAKGNGAGPVLAGAITWTCAFCARSDNAVAEGAFNVSTANADDHPELVADVVDYASKTPHIPAAPHRQAIVLLLDERLRISEAEWARIAARATYECAAESGKMFALITYGAGVAVADFSNITAPAPVALDLLSATRAARMQPAEKKIYFCDLPTSNDAPIVPSERVLAILHRAVTASIDHGAVGADDGEELPLRRSNDTDEVMEPRRLDEALNVALELLAGVADTENSRVITLMTGSPTLEETKSPTGEPIVPPAGELDTALRARFEALGSRAGDMRLALDFLCFGATDDYAANAILGAARRSRGGIVYSGAHGFVSGTELANSARFLAQRSTNPGVVSIRVSSPLTVSRVIGPAFPTAAPHTYAVPGVDPTAGFTVTLQPHVSAGGANEFPSHIVMQLAAKSSFVTRVITVRIPITKNTSDFLDSVDSEVSAVVLGKACIVSNNGLTQPVVAARAVDLSVKALLNADLKCVSVARLLFELRRGFMLERHGNSDSALIQRALFLRLEGTLASLLLSPRLFTNAIADEDTGLMAEVPLDVTSLRDDSVMVLDAGFNIFLLVGSAAESDAEEAVTKSAQKVAKQRSFPCQLWPLKQGEESAKLIESYLVSAPARESRLRLPRLRTVKAINEMTFYGYCKMLAPGSATVRVLAESV